MTRTPNIVRHRCGPRKVYHTSECPGAIVDHLASDPDELVETGKRVKAGDRTSIVRVEHEQERFALKRYNLKGPLHTSTHLLLRSRAAWSWSNGWKLIEADLRSPRPVARVEELRGPFRLRSFLLTEWVEGTTLLDWTAQQNTGAVESMARQFGRVWARLGELGLGHGDMKATNFLVDDESSLWLIDLDGTRRHRIGPLLDRARSRDRARFLRNWQDRPEVAEIFRAQIDRA